MHAVISANIRLSVGNLFILKSLVGRSSHMQQMPNFVTLGGCMQVLSGFLVSQNLHLGMSFRPGPRGSKGCLCTDPGWCRDKVIDLHFASSDALESIEATNNVASRN